MNTGIITSIYLLISSGSMLYGCDEQGKTLQHLNMLIKHDLKGNLKWMSPELDKTEVTMYFYGLFHYKVLMYITGLFCVWVMQNVCSTSWAHCTCHACFSHFSRVYGKFGRCLLIYQYFIRVYIFGNAVSWNCIVQYSD